MGSQNTSHVSMICPSRTCKIFNKGNRADEAKEALMDVYTVQLVLGWG